MHVPLALETYKFHFL